jgi:hypothetical protein
MAIFLSASTRDGGPPLTGAPLDLARFRNVEGHD